MFGNLKDKIKSIFKSDITQTAPAQQKARGYYAPDFGSQSYGSGSKFPSGMSASKYVTLHNHTALRQASREMMHDSVDMRALVTSVVDTVVDSGMRLKPTPIAEIIGITPEEAETWAEDISQKFHLWASSKQSHRSRINTYYQNQRFFQLQKQRDGEVFIRLYYGREKDTFSPLQIDFIDPNQIRGFGLTSTWYNPQTDDGIVRDGAGREIGYKIYNFNTITGEYSETTIPAVGEKSGRIFMMHSYNPEYPGQGRGYPPLTHALQEFEQLTDFKIATVQKAIQQASIVMAVMNDKKDPSNPMIGRVAGPMPTYGQPPQDSTQDSGDETQPVINYTAMPEATFTQPGVGVFNLTEGDRLEYLKDTSPSPQFDVFVNSFFGSIVASTGYSIETVLKRFNSNYSASRATLILCWRVANIERSEQNADFDNPIYEMWLSEEIAAGRVQAKGWSDPFIKSAWLCSEWAGSVMPNIDPQKSASADLSYVQMGAQTLDDVARNFNGSSGKANRIKLKRQWDELPEPKLPIAPIYKETDKSDDNNADDKKYIKAVARDDMITVTTPTSDVEFKVKKRSIKKTAKYKDYDGIERQMEIFEEEI